MFKSRVRITPSRPTGVDRNGPLIPRTGPRGRLAPRHRAPPIARWVLVEAVLHTSRVASPHSLARRRIAALAVAVAALLGGPWAAPAAAQVIDATTYPFSFASAAALEDMSSGTTTLIGADQDNAVSEVVPIGFEFWFSGSRQIGRAHV